MLWCPYGSILIKLDDGHEKSEVLLDDRQGSDRRAQYVARNDLAAGKFRALRRGGFYYEAEDYIRDYDEFLKTVQAKG